MKIIQITDDDAKQLLDELKLEALSSVDQHRFESQLEVHGVKATVQDMHRAFHYRVTQWLQKHGADLSK